MRDIAAGEELTIDYAMIEDDETELECRCGQVFCRGTITGRDWRRPELQTEVRRVLLVVPTAEDALTIASIFMPHEGETFPPGPDASAPDG